MGLTRSRGSMQLWSDVNLACHGGFVYDLCLMGCSQSELTFAADPAAIFARLARMRPGAFPWSLHRSWAVGKIALGAPPQLS